MTPQEAEAAAAAAIAKAKIGASSPPLSPSQSLTTSRSFPASPLRHPALECDYDKNPTYLYQAIEARQWESAEKYLSKDNQDSACWVTRKETNGKLRWRLLPIHAAVIFKAPIEFVEALLSDFPAGAQCKDDQGMLPLHLAFRNGAEWEVLEELITAFPQGIHVKDRKGRAPLQCASQTFKRQASVLELFTQISISTERKKAVQESRSVLEARVTSLQDSNVKILTTLKKECQEKIDELEGSLEEKDKQVEEVKAKLAEKDKELEDKEVIEQELTKKLEEVSVALQTLIAVRTEEDSVMRKNVEKKERVLTKANQELKLLVQTLMDQQLSLKVTLDKQSWESKEKSDDLDNMLEAFKKQRLATETENSNERDLWRGLLEDSNKNATERLDKIMEDQKEATTEPSLRPSDTTDSDQLNLERSHPVGSTVTDEKKEEKEAVTKA